MEEFEPRIFLRKPVRKTGNRGHLVYKNPIGENIIKDFAYRLEFFLFHPILLQINTDKDYILLQYLLSFVGSFLVFIPDLRIGEPSLERSTDHPSADNSDPWVHSISCKRLSTLKAKSSTVIASTKDFAFLVFVLISPVYTLVSLSFKSSKSSHWKYAIESPK